MRTERDAFFAHFSKLVEAEDLESAGVGQNRAVPRHEAVQAAESADLLYARPQIKVISIAQENLNTEFFEDVLRHGFHGSLCSNGHKDRGFDFPMRRGESAATGRAVPGFNLELNRHCWDCIEPAGAQLQPQQAPKCEIGNGNVTLVRIS